MYTLSLIYIFILGALVGSFLHVVSSRYNTGMSVVKGRSICFHCGKKLKWYELLPIVSFFFLRGKCRKCKTHLSWTYPLVEILTGFIFVGVAIRQYYYWPLYSMYTHGLLYSVLFFVYYATVFSLLTVIVLYDIRHKIIPDRFVYAFIALAFGKLLLYLYIKGLPFGLADMFDIGASFILFIPFALTWFMSSGRWIGFGDAKLVLGIGALLGFVSGLSAVIVAFWIGAAYSIYLLIHSRYISKKFHIGLKSEVPFAPFLVIATIIIFFTHADVLGLRNFLELF